MVSSLSGLLEKERSAETGVGQDVLKGVQVYINKAITATSGIKVLLLDAETVSVRVSFL